jgi:hypothetical protein
MEEKMPTEPEGSSDIRRLWSEVVAEVSGVTLSGIAVGLGVGLGLAGIPYAWAGAVCGGIGIVRGFTAINRKFSNFKMPFP